MRTGGRRRICIAAAITAAALGVGHVPASAKDRVDSFEGSCSLQGTVKFSPPATNTQQRLSVSYDATGTCSGTLNGRTVSNAPVRARHVARDVDGSCVHADTTRPGRGAITFPDGTTIAFTFEFHFVATNGVFTFHGQRSGSARGTGSFLTQRTPPDLALKCGGEGVSEAPLDIELITDSPLVSGRPGHGGGKHHGTDSRASTFTGSCQFSGRVVFQPPLTDDPQSVKQRVRAPGVCSGTFVDRRGRTHQLSDAPVTFSESSQGDNASCAAGTAAGRGALRFQHGRIRFAFSETRATGTVVGSATGAKSGSAHGVATVSRSEDPAAIAQQCAGSGIKRVNVDVELTTTPSISG
jgi:hypothetical protein